MSEEEIIEENIRRYIKEHTTTIKAYTQEYVDNLQNQLQQKENIINEVTEYIKDNAVYSEGHCKCSFSSMALDNLLDILQGSDKE